MGEDSFFNALFHIMWNMETDIFSERDKTLGLLADIVPKCRKQRKRLEAMYDCGAMDFIEKAVADREYYVLNMKRTVRILISEMNLSCEKALFSVNQIAELWDGDLDMITEYDENENLDDEKEPNSENNSDNEENPDSRENLNNENNSENEENPNSEEQNDNNISCDDSRKTADNENNNNEQDGDESMIFLQEVAEEEANAEAQEEQQIDEVQDEGGGEGESGEEAQPEPQPPKDSVFKKVVQFWCRSDLEEGRPYMVACPIGWVLILLCSAMGAFMIYDIPLGDKFYVPTFAFMFSVLTSKRLYRHESTGRFSLLIGAFYLAAMGRVLWLGKGFPPIVCVPMVLAALIVFNSGRIGSFLDESKKNSFFAYVIIIVFSAAVTVGAYSIQQVDF